MILLEFFRLWLTSIVLVGTVVNLLEVYAARKMLQISIRRGFDHIHVRIARAIKGEAYWRFWTQVTFVPIVSIMWLMTPVPSQLWYAMVARTALVIMAHLASFKAIWSRYERLEVMEDIEADIYRRRQTGT